MPKRSYYPNKITQKYQPGDPGSDLNGTELQEEAARALRDHWDADATFNSVTEQSTVSRTTIQRVFDHCFRSVEPIETEYTVHELEERFGDADRYYEAKRTGSLASLQNETATDADGSIDALLSDHERKLAQFFYEKGRADERREQELET